MKKIFDQKNMLIFGAAIFIAVLSRLTNHHWNFTAVGAAVFAFALLFPTDKKMFFIPVISLFISDLFLGFHDTMLFVYGGYMLALVPFVLAGANSSRLQSTLQKVLTVLSGSLIFFVVSNFGVWLAGQLYPQTVAGLIETYVMGLPFYKNQFLSDIMLTPALFYVFKMMYLYQLAAKSAQDNRSKI